MVCIIKTVFGGAWPHDATKAGAVVEYSAAAVSGQRVSAWLIILTLGVQMNFNMIFTFSRHTHLSIHCFVFKLRPTSDFHFSIQNPAAILFSGSVLRVPSVHLKQPATVVWMLLFFTLRETQLPASLDFWQFDVDACVE